MFKKVCVSELIKFRTFVLISFCSAAVSPVAIVVGVGAPVDHPKDRIALTNKRKKHTEPTNLSFRNYMAYKAEQN